METINTLSDAMNFFLENSSGSVFCKRGGISKEVHSFIEAKAFFNGWCFEPAGKQVHHIDAKRKFIVPSKLGSYEPVEHTDDKTYVAYGFACSGLHSSLARVTSTKDGSSFDWEVTGLEVGNVRDIAERISSIAGGDVVAVNIGGLGYEVNQALALKVGAINVPIRLDSLAAVKGTLEEELLSQLALSNSAIASGLNFRKDSCSANDNSAYKAILAAYSVIANPPQPKAEKDEYIEIKGDGYCIKFKVSDLNCGKGIDYNVETGQLVISKLPDSVVAQLKEIFNER